MAIEIAQMVKLGTQYTSKSSQADACFAFQGWEEVSMEEILVQRGRRSTHKEDMEELISSKKEELKSQDMGKSFRKIVEEMSDDIETWLRQ